MDRFKHVEEIVRSIDDYEKLMTEADGFCKYDILALTGDEVKAIEGGTVEDEEGEEAENVDFWVSSSLFAAAAGIAGYALYKFNR